MKKIVFFPIIGVLVLFAVLVSCSKDDQLIRQDVTKAYYKPGSTPEVLNGSVKGILDPVPSYASILLKGDMGYVVEKKAFADGSFWFDNLPAGDYYMKITYVVNNAGHSYTTSHEIETVRVQAGVVSEMGIVKLPWTY